MLSGFRKDMFLFFYDKLDSEYNKTLFLALHVFLGDLYFTEGMEKYWVLHGKIGEEELD